MAKGSSSSRLWPGHRSGESHAHRYREVIQAVTNIRICLNYTENTSLQAIWVASEETSMCRKQRSALPGSNSAIWS